MAILRNKSQQGFTIVDNYALKDKRLSLKATGLLVKMLSLPDYWEFSEAGLAAIVKDGITSIRSAIKELEGLGYLVRTRNRNDKGAFTDCDWEVIAVPDDCPQLENPKLDNPTLEITHNKALKGNKTTKLNKTTNKAEAEKSNETAESVIEQSEFSDEVKRSLREFAEYREERKQPLTARAAEKAINVLRSLPDDETRVKSIDQSILNNWRGLFDVKGSFGSGSNDKRGMVQAHYEESYVPF